MDVNLRHLRSFIAVAELGSFTRAARLLHLSQPALTVQVRKLEEALKIRLLDRDSRSVALTSAGRELLPALEAALRGIDEIVLEIASAGGRQTRRRPDRYASFPRRQSAPRDHQPIQGRPAGGDLCRARRCREPRCRPGGRRGGRPRDHRRRGSHGGPRSPALAARTGCASYSPATTPWRPSAESCSGTSSTCPLFSPTAQQACVPSSNRPSSRSVDGRSSHGRRPT